ncbi:flagellar hook assembly protein FlgD [Teichococcus aestuarii]|uniref:flagellar hook assembly protein FlgD n=1 Tax=Teichococcus aestuarii TaxID=568898 RepID=UPI00361EADC4
MASVSNVTATSNAAAASTGAAASGPATAKLNSSSPDFDRFLTLLTAQMKFQNPLEPTDPTQFVAQLAQFSQVEQQTKTNSLLQGIATSLSGGGGLAENAALLGRTVQMQMSRMVLPTAGANVPVTVDVPAGSLTNLRLEVLNSAGEVVRQVPVQTGSTQLSFDGKDSNGVALAAGSYAVRVIGQNAENARQVAGTITSSGKVTEVRRDSSGEMNLVLDNGNVVSATDITRLGA